MPKVHVTSDIEIDFDEVLNGLARLGTSDLAQLVEQVIALHARRRAPSMPKNEADLLQKINQGPAPEVHQELLQLIDQIELTDAERMQHLIALSQLRQVSVDALMHQLGMRPPAY